MLSNSRSQAGKNSGDNVLAGISVRSEEHVYIHDFFRENDLYPNSRRAIVNDLRKFAKWCVEANAEPFDSSRVATIDVCSFRDHLSRERQQAVATINRAICSVRKYFQWLAVKGHLDRNPARDVKELRREQLAPQGLDRSQVRSLLRETELRRDIRGRAIFSLFLWTGCRVGDLVELELEDMLIKERSGSALFRHGKGGKQRTVPLPIDARRAMTSYLETRPAIESKKVFIGERGALTERGVRSLCSKYSAFVGFHLHPHLLRHTFAKRYIETSGDLAGLAQLLGHANINTTARYTLRSIDDLSDGVDQLSY
jgi:site-specific recombinase XerD